MKKITANISLFIVLVALMLAMAAAFFAPSQIAHADDAVNTISVIKAPVSNLEGNATAGKSTVAVFDNYNRKFYIPESYYLYEIETVILDTVYRLRYIDADEDIYFYLYEEPITTQITAIEGEQLTPDVRLTLKNETASLLTQKTTEGEIEYLPAKSISNEYTIKLLGYSEDASKIYVSVTFNGEKAYGFIAVEDLETFTVPYQQRAQAERDALLASKEEANKPGSIPAPSTSVGLRIVIIVGIAVPTVIIILLLFKPSKDERRYAKNTVRNSRSKDDFDYDDSRSYRNRDRRDDRDYERDRDYDRRDRDYERDYDRDYDRRDRRDDRDYRRDDYRDDYRR